MNGSIAVHIWKSSTFLRIVEFEKVSSFPKPAVHFLFSNFAKSIKKFFCFLDEFFVCFFVWIGSIFFFFVIVFDEHKELASLAELN